MSLRTLERELLVGKKWTLKGEVKAKDRPQNSLLTESNIIFPYANYKAEIKNNIRSNIESVDEYDLESSIIKITKLRALKNVFDNIKYQQAKKDHLDDNNFEELVTDLTNINQDESLLDWYGKKFHVTEAGKSVDVIENEKKAIELYKNIAEKLEACKIDI